MRLRLTGSEIAGMEVILRVINKVRSRVVNEGAVLSKKTRPEGFEPPTP